MRKLIAYEWMTLGGVVQAPRDVCDGRMIRDRASCVLGG